MNNEEIIAEYEADRNNPENHNTKRQDRIKALDKARASGRQEFICRNCADIWNTDTSDEFEAGKQSAQKEIEELKQQLAQKDKELESKAHEVDIWMSLSGEKNDKLEQFKAEKQEQVRKLKHDLPRMGLTDDVFVILINKVIEIFPDCILRKEKGKGE